VSSRDPGKEKGATASHWEQQPESRESRGSGVEIKVEGSLRKEKKTRGEIYRSSITSTKRATPDNKVRPRFAESSAPAKDGKEEESPGGGGGVWRGFGGWGLGGWGGVGGGGGGGGVPPEGARVNTETWSLSQNRIAPTVGYNQPVKNGPTKEELRLGKMAREWRIHRTSLPKRKAVNRARPVTTGSKGDKDAERTLQTPSDQAPSARDKKGGRKH